MAVYMFAQTVGIRPRQKSGAQRINFCPPCSVSLAMGPAPEGALNIAAWNMLRDVVGADPALNEAAWQAYEASLATSQRRGRTARDGHPRMATLSFSDPKAIRGAGRCTPCLFKHLRRTIASITVQPEILTVR